MSDNLNTQYAIRNASWEEVFREDNWAALEAILPDYIRARRWFGGKARTIQAVRIVEAIPLHHANSTSYLTLIRVEYTEGDPQTYVLPLTFASEENVERIESEAPAAILTRLGENEITHYAALRITSPGVLYDATWDKEFAVALLDAVERGERFGTASGEIRASATETFREMFGSVEASLEPSVMGAEQSNTSLVYGDRFILKLFRRLEEGTSPDLEVGRFLAQKGFSHTPPVVGAFEHYREQGEPITLAILQGYVRNRGDAWRYTLDSLAPYFEQAVKRGSSEGIPAIPQHHLLDLLGEETPIAVSEAIGAYVESARLLGRRTAEMHIVLASDESDPAFAPEPFSAAYQQSIYDSVVGMVDEGVALLRREIGSLPGEAQPEAQAIVDGREELLSRMEPLRAREVTAPRIRCHGDYHLGQVLYTGSNFVIIDFEGEPVRSLHERRRKHSPLKDVAGMLRSFHYAAYAAMMGIGDSAPHLSTWADNWHLWVSVAYLKEYLEVAGSAVFLPRTREELRLLLDTYLLEKATYELLYELNNRPDWVRIPLQGITQLNR